VNLPNCAETGGASRRNEWESYEKENNIRGVHGVQAHEIKKGAEEKMDPYTIQARKKKR